MSITAATGLALLQLINVNNIASLEDGWLNIGNNDPYIHFHAPEADSKSAASAAGVLLSYELKDFPETYRSEFWFSTNIHPISKRFRYTFELEGKKMNHLFIPVDLFDSEQLKTLRWDFDGCGHCKINITNVAFPEKAAVSDYTLHTPASYKPLLFIKENPIKKANVSYQIQDFHIDGFEHLGGNILKLKRRNHFISSPDLNMRLSLLGGVYLKLGVPPTQDDSLYFNLGWRSLKHGYRNKMRLRARNVNSNENSNENGSVFEMFIPFEGLSNEKFIHNFRLSFEPEIDDIWTFESIELIQRSQLSKFEHLKPDIVDYPGALSSVSNILKTGFRKLTKDIWFLLVYLCSFLLVIIGLVFIIRSAKKKAFH